MEEDLVVEGPDVSEDLVQEVVASYTAPEVDDGIVLIPASADERDRAAASSPVVPLAEFASSPRDAEASVAAMSEDARFLQTILTTEEGEMAGREADTREQEALELDEEEEDEEEREAEVEGGEVDSQEGTVSASEADWEFDEERTAPDEPAEPQDVQLPEDLGTQLQQVEREGEREGEGEGEGEGEEEEGGVVTQRDEEIENYQSTVKELTSAVIDREEKIGVHQLELQWLHVHVYGTCTDHMYMYRMVVYVAGQRVSLSLSLSSLF